MKTTIEEISPVKKKLTVEIDSQEVDSKLSTAYRDLSKQAKIPGFRPGKVPRSILERRFGPQIADDVSKALINETLPQAMQEASAFPLGLPLLEKDPLDKGKKFLYSAVMEVRPTFDLENYLNIEVQKEIFELTDEAVQKQMEQIRLANGKLQPLQQERPVKQDDYVVLNYEAFENGETLEGMKADNFLLKVGSQDFHPDFEKSLIGLNKEDETTILVHFAEDYHHKALAGKDAEFKVLVIDIKEMELPDINDDFARSLGAELESLEALKEKVKESITAQETKRIETEVNRSLIEKISETVDFELPPVLVESELDYAVQKVRQNLTRSGSNFEKAGLSEEKLKEEFRVSAEKRVKEMLILGEIARKEDLDLSDEDLDKGFNDLAASMGQDTETIRKYYEARDLVGSLQEKLLEEKTLNYLVEHAKISDIKKDVHTSKNEKKSKKEKE